MPTLELTTETGVWPQGNRSLWFWKWGQFHTKHMVAIQWGKSRMDSSKAHKHIHHTTSRSEVNSHLKSTAPPEELPMGHSPLL